MNARINHTHFTLFCILFCLLTSPLLARQGATASDPIKVLIDERSTFAPGGQVRIGVEALLSNDKRKRTKGYAGGKYKWKNFEVQVKGGSWSGEGLIMVNHDPTSIENDQLEVTIRHLKSPSLQVTEIISLTYDAEVFADFSGQRGARVKARGARLFPLRLLGMGAAGKDGHKGKRGTDGQDIEVYITTAYNASLDKTLLKAEVRSKTTKQVTRYLIDPAKGKFFVTCEGGQGGEGGEGGPGVDGRDGIEKERDGNDGSDGGIGGEGGPGGNGGRIWFYIDPSAEPYMEAIDYANGGGLGGLGGRGGNGGDGGVGCSGCSDGDGGLGGLNGELGPEGLPGPEPVFVTQTVQLDW